MKFILMSHYFSVNVVVTQQEYREAFSVPFITSCNRYCLVKTTEIEWMVRDQIFYYGSWSDILLSLVHVVGMLSCLNSHKFRLYRLSQICILFGK
jgi:hypothetical protein